MAHDALWPGPDNTYPNFPRRLDGSPAWSDSAETDGVAIPGRGPDGLVSPMPRGIRHIVRRGQRIAVNVTPSDVNGDPIVVPKIP